MRRTLTLVALTLGLFSFPALPQQAPATASVEGVVVRSDTGQPIVNAQVGLSSVQEAAIPQVTPRPAENAPVTTGADGRFAFKDLQAGAYRLGATANGFVRQDYGQVALSGQGRVLYLTAGQSFNAATLRLTATGTVSGHVYDERGQPATGAIVRLIQVTFGAQGNKLYGVFGNATVDDRGNFRIFGATPGRYYLVAGTPLGPAVLRGTGGPGAPAARFSEVFYPTSTDLENASAFEVKAGGEVSFDMRVMRSKTFTVRGRVVDGTGAGIPANLTINLGYRSFNSSFSMVGARTIDAATGAFEMLNVPSGEYFVQAQVQPAVAGPRGAGGLQALQSEQASRPSASVPIRVVDFDIEGLVLTLSTGAVVNGRIVVEGAPLSAVPNLAGLRIVFGSTVNSGMLPIPGTLPAAIIAADGTFRVNGVREGDYRFQLNVPGFHVKSLKYGGTEILGKPFKFSGRASDSLEVTLRANVATVNGRVTDGKAQPVSGINVVFVPVDRTLLDRFRTVSTDQNGRYSMQNLAAGEYKAFSWESIDNSAYFDPDFMKQYEPLGKAIVVSESTNPNADLKLIPAQ